MPKLKWKSSSWRLEKPEVANVMMTFLENAEVSERHDDVLRKQPKWANVMMTFCENHQSEQTS